MKKKGKKEESGVHLREFGRNTQLFFNTNREFLFLTVFFFTSRFGFCYRDFERTGVH